MYRDDGQFVSLTVDHDQKRWPDWRASSGQGSKQVLCAENRRVVDCESTTPVFVLVLALAFVRECVCVRVLIPLTVDHDPKLWPDRRRIWE